MEVRHSSDVGIQHRSHYLTFCSADLAPECASSYYRYGSVLLYQAQDNADVFGATLDTDVHQDLENKENEKSGGTDHGPEERIEEELENADKGKGMRIGDVQDTEGAAAVTGGEAEQVQAEPDATDLEIAWENLDTARAIWERDPEQNCHDLASVHVLLGDVALENEAFNDSLVDYEQALKYQKMAKFPEDDRRTAEVYFKRVMALQFLEQPEGALIDVKTAQGILEQRLKNLEASGEDVKDEIEDVKAILEDLKDKTSELNAQVQEKKDMADTVRNALSNFQEAAQGANASDPKPQGHDLGATNKSNISSPVKDLGVVGRGTKRINLAPMAAHGETKKGDSNGDGEAEKKARSMESLMGEGDTTVGFGNQADN
jgi:HAT1-interacting factor 1